MLQLRSSELAPGHSGAPIWDEQIQCIVGMVSQVFIPGQDTKNRDTAFAIPIEIVKQILKDLEKWNVK